MHDGFSVRIKVSLKGVGKFHVVSKHEYLTMIKNIISFDSKEKQTKCTSLINTNSDELHLEVKLSIFF